MYTYLYICLSGLLWRCIFASTQIVLTNPFLVGRGTCEEKSWTHRCHRLARCGSQCLLDVMRFLQCVSNMLPPKSDST